MVNYIQSINFMQLNTKTTLDKTRSKETSFRFMSGMCHLPVYQIDIVDKYQQKERHKSHHITRVSISLSIFRWIDSLTWHLQKTYLPTTICTHSQYLPLLTILYYLRKKEDEKIQCIPKKNKNIVFKNKVKVKIQPYTLISKNLVN